MGSIRRQWLLVVPVALLLLLAAGTGSASATMPWWKVRTMSVRPLKAGDEGAIIVEAVNLGDAAANKLFEGVTVADKLPPGVTATAVYGEGGGEFNGLGWGQSEVSSCSLATTTCTFLYPVMPYERVLLQIEVKVAPGAGAGENEASVSGGMAAPVLSQHALALEGIGSYGVENYELSAEEEGGGSDTQAGSHPFQLTTSFTLNLRNQPVVTVFGHHQFEAVAYATTKDLRFDLPAGLIGNPTPIPKCSTELFTHSVGIENAKCPPDTVVGAVMTAIAGRVNSSVPNAPFEVSVPLYSLEPAHGEPARFGFIAGDLFPVILDTSVRTGGDYGVVVNVPDVVSDVSFLTSQVTFWGTPSDPRHDTSRGEKCLGNGLHYALSGEEEACPGNAGQPFLIMPTSCTGPLKTSMSVESWEQPGTFTPPTEFTVQNSEGEPYGLDGCNRLNFQPSITVAPDGQEGSAPTGLTVGIHVPQQAGLNPTGLADSTVRDTTVTLPAGVALNPSAADGLLSCSTEQVGLDDAAPISCPEASKVGTVEIHTPLLPNPLVGAAYLATQDANPFGSLIALYVVVQDPVSGVLVKLAGQVTPNPVTGQLVSTFNETPNLPFEELNLHFFGGSRAPLSTPPLCGSYNTTASFTPWSGNPPAEASSTFYITSGPNNTPCANPRPFQPGFAAGTTNVQAGGYSPLTMTMDRPDADQPLGKLSIVFPPGVSAGLEGVKLCQEPQAAEGKCPAESQIGRVTASAGLGGNPYPVETGKVYITGPYEGDPFGVVIVVPAIAGPFNLGTEVVRAKIDVDPTDAHLTVVSDPFPTILEGIPLELQHINVTINRPGFVFNPTSCEPMKIVGEVESIEGAKADVSTPFQVTNCAALSFKPEFKVSTSAKTSRIDGATLHVNLTLPNAPRGTQANVAKVKVSLPKQLPSPLKTLQKACTEKVFAENPSNCPVASRVGEAHVSTPVLEGGLSGPAYFVSYGGAKYPELILVLTGEDGVTVQVHGETFISKQGITSATFNTVPDVPFSGFELTLPQREYPAITANGNLCKGTLIMPTEFVGQNGVKITQNTKIAVTGCPKVKRATHKKASHKKKAKAKSKHRQKRKGK
jgi:hypothetical protein